MRTPTYDEVYCAVRGKHTSLDHLSLDILIEGHLSGDVIFIEAKGGVGRGWLQQYLRPGQNVLNQDKWTDPFLISLSCLIFVCIKAGRLGTDFERVVWAVVDGLTIAS